MSAPSAESLFTMVFSTMLNDEETMKPGDTLWTYRNHAYWGRVWRDCKALSAHLERCEALAAELQEVVTAPADWDPGDL